ncbi:Uncharacterised protein [Vibrio cholerae]|nr:Uncharacterised protein [Vibrio cholerae]CSC52975.1 Uncharacterised protein [Vibrio cholerae]
MAAGLLLPSDFHCAAFNAAFCARRLDLYPPYQTADVQYGAGRDRHEPQPTAVDFTKCV